METRSTWGRIRYFKIPEPILIVAAGLVDFAIFSLRGAV